MDNIGCSGLVPGLLVMGMFRNLAAHSIRRCLGHVRASRDHVQERFGSQLNTNFRQAFSQPRKDFVNVNLDRRVCAEYLAF
jgi:hypothetical protein